MVPFSQNGACYMTDACMTGNNSCVYSDNGKCNEISVTICYEPAN